MSLSAATKIGAYEIVALIGAGGMGEVYRARDTRLKREVAIKVLPDAFANDPERLARFQREAELLATLNHPNIAQIHGIEDRALVLELVEGPTLADRIAQGPIPLDEALPIARQIAEALEAAHERGVIHRDLKPANIKLTPDGRVKVLDFGLAKAMAPDHGPAKAGHYVPDLSASPTITSPAMTMGGVILGTAAYMSPEQAAGKPVDGRSDLWAFGVVLMEMLTATPVFGGETVAHVLASILKTEPNWSALPNDVPQPLRRLLRRCLQKDRNKRLAHASDARLEIEDAQAGEAVAQSLSPSGSGRPHVLVWTLPVLGVVALLIGSYATAVSRATVEPEPAVSLTIEPPPGTRFAYGPDPRLVIAPDGKSLVFSAIDENGQSQLWLRHLDQLDARPIPGTTRAVSPFFSPDSRAIGFMVDSQLRRLDLSGGLAATVLNIERPNLRGAYWTETQTILLGAWRGEIGIGEVPSNGGEARVVTTPVPSEGDETHRFPVMLPDGRRLMYLVRAKPGHHGIFVSEIGKPQRQLVLRALTSFAVVEPGWLLYGDAGRLMAASFSSTNAEVTGEPRVLVPSVVHWPGSTKTEFSVSARALAFRRGSSAARIDRFSRNGTLRDTIVPAAAIEGRFGISSDGKTIAYAVVDADTGRRGIWVGDTVRGTQRRVTPATVNTWQPVWSPDGGKLAARVDGGAGIIDLKGVAIPEMLPNTPTGTVRSWSSDGRVILEQEIAGRTDLSLYDLNDHQSVPLVSSSADEAFGTISPSGNLVAYVSNESGRDEVYLRTLAPNAAPIQVSLRGGTKPAWSHDGNHVYYLAPSGMILVAAVSAGTVVSAGEPRMLFQTDPNAYFAVTSEDDIVVQYVPDNLRHPNISVIVHWQRLLDSRGHDENGRLVE